MSEMRAQKLEPCEKPKDAWYPNPCDKYWGFSAGGKCDGCNGDGTRWVTVGTLRQPTFATFGMRVLQAYLLEGGCAIRELDESEAEVGDMPLFVIEDSP